MFFELILVTFGLCLLYFGGELLVKGAVDIGERIGLSTLVIGLTLVAFGTSAPELAVSLDAALTDHPDIAIANILGSNLANLGLVAGITAIVGRVVLDRDLAMKDLPVMLTAMLLLTWLLYDASLSRTEGVLLTTALVIYVSYRVMQGKRLVSTQFKSHPNPADTNPTTPAARILVGLLLLGFGGDLLVDNAAHLAGRFHVSEAFIGFSVVAIGTSLPEIATSIAAVRLGQGKVAIGNIIGSNIWNSLGVLGVSGVWVRFELC